MEITNSQEWVHHNRGGSEPALVRKYQKVAWDLIFGKKQKKEIIHDLNHKFLPSNIKLIVFDLSEPEDAMRQLKELLQNTEYDVHYTIKPK